MFAGPNSAKAVQMGRVSVKFPKLNNMEVYGLYAPANISGTTVGRRVFNWADKLRVYAPFHNLYAEINFNSDDKGLVGNLFSRKSIEADKVSGKLYQLRAWAMKDLYSKNPKSNTKWTLEHEKHVSKELETIEGRWTKYLAFNGKSYWNIEEVKPFLLIDIPNKALPSDSNFREDLIYRKLGDFENGQLAKERMEDAQRADKKLRMGNKKDKDSKH